MDNFEKKIADNLNSLAWSLWDELGLPGVVNHHSNCLVDLEALIVFTSLINVLDPRLQELINDWQWHYRCYISMSRLRLFQKILSPTPLSKNCPILFDKSKKAGKHHILLQLERPANAIVRCRSFYR